MKIGIDGGAQLPAEMLGQGAPGYEDPCRDGIDVQTCLQMAVDIYQRLFHAGGKAGTGDGDVVGREKVCQKGVQRLPQLKPEKEGRLLHLFQKKALGRGREGKWLPAAAEQIDSVGGAQLQMEVDVIHGLRAAVGKGTARRQKIPASRD